MKRAFILSFLTVIGIIFFGCTKEEETGTIYGIVTDFATGEPIKNVNVKLRPDGITTKTGSDGTYSFQDMKPGKYALTLSHADYEDADDDHIITVHAGKSVSRDVQMKKKIVPLLITDMNGDPLPDNGYGLPLLDFGTEASVTSRSFNIVNVSSEPVNSCSITHNECEWVASITSISVPIIPGQTVPIVVTIDREHLAGGNNATILHIISDHGANELELRAIGLSNAEIVTAEATNVTANSALCGGEVTNDGGSPVTERGVCWALTQSPTIEGG